MVNITISRSSADIQNRILVWVNNRYALGKNVHMSTILVLEIKGSKNNKMFNFLNDRFSVMGGPITMIFGVFSETVARLLKSIISQFCSKDSKSYNILNAKSCLKLEGP